MSETTPEPGWYADPGRPGAQRWWDGARWGPPPPPPSGVVAQPNPPNKKRGRGCITGLAAVVALLVVIGVIGAVAGSSKKSSPSTPTAGTTATSAPSGAPGTTAALPSKAPAGTTPTAPASGIAGDVITGDCSVDSSGFPHASVTVTNHSSKASMYIYLVEFDGADGKRVASGTGVQQQVLPGQSAHDDVMGFAQLSPGAVATCKPYDVTRTAA